MKKDYGQLSFNFLADLEPYAPIMAEMSPSEELEALRTRCRNILCTKKAALGKAYCSKAHSPFGMLDDEPDNAPVEWTAPEGFYRWTPQRTFT